MIYSHDEVSLFSRLTLSFASLGLIGTANSILYLFGYNGYALVYLEAFLIIISMVLLLWAISADANSLPSFRTSMKIFLTFDLGFQIAVQSMASLSYSEILTRMVLVVVLYIASTFLTDRINIESFFKREKYPRFLVYASTALLAGYLIYYANFLSVLYSDEFAIDYFSALIFSHGLNPYLTFPAILVFSPIHISQSLMTPIMTGGFVSNLSYPALSFMIYLPSVLLRFNPYLTLIPIYLVPMILIYRSETSLVNRFAMICPLILTPLLISQFSLGFSDILWASLLSASIILMNRPAYSGLFLGLSIALKQIPLLILPFMIIFIFRKYGFRKTVAFMASLAVVFSIVNGYFLLINPGAYIHDVLSPETTSLIGIGFGPSQISFLGYFYLSRYFFTFMIAFLTLFFAAIYYIYFKQIGYGFIAFPILIFLFNYRSVSEYFMYWPIVAILSLPFVARKTAPENEKGEKKRCLVGRTGIRKIATVMVVLLSVTSVGIFVFHSEYPLSITSMTPDYSSGEIRNISVSFVYNGNNLSNHLIYFRITGDHPMVSQNGFIWETQHNISLLSGHVYSLYIIPMGTSNDINISGTFHVTAYYIHNLGSYRDNLVINVN